MSTRRRAKKQKVRWGGGESKREGERKRESGEREGTRAATAAEIQIQIS